jgi:6-pyruvoyltetrahydropterin/6-carboxytetrahydropterin synthase
MRIGIVDHIDCAHAVRALDGCHLTHGHTYKVEIVVEGPLKDGIVMDFKILKAEAKKVLARYDHGDLNLLMDVPSCEHLCIALLKELRAAIPGTVEVRCWEGVNKWALATLEDLQ